MCQGYMKALNGNKNEADICFVSMATPNFICATGRTEKIIGFCKEDSLENYIKVNKQD